MTSLINRNVAKVNIVNRGVVLQLHPTCINKGQFTWQRQQQDVDRGNKDTTAEHPFEDINTRTTQSSAHSRELCLGPLRGPSGIMAEPGVERIGRPTDNQFTKNQNTKNNDQKQFSKSASGFCQLLDLGLRKMTGYELNHIKSFHNICQLLHSPRDGSSLAVARIFYGKPIWDYRAN